MQKLCAIFKKALSLLRIIYNFIKVHYGLIVIIFVCFMKDLLNVRAKYLVTVNLIFCGPTKVECSGNNSILLYAPERRSFYF